MFIVLVTFNSCCKITGCHRLAEYLEGIKKNFEGTAQVLKENCENNLHSESCYKLGTYYLYGKGEEQLAFETFQAFMKSTM